MKRGLLGFALLPLAGAQYIVALVFTAAGSELAGALLALSLPLTLGAAFWLLLRSGL